MRSPPSDQFLFASVTDAFVVGNAWAAAGMTRVLASIQHSSFAAAFTAETADLATWVNEILTASFSHIDVRKPSFFLYFDFLKESRVRTAAHHPSLTQLLQRHGDVRGQQLVSPPCGHGIPDSFPGESQKIGHRRDGGVHPRGDLRERQPDDRVAQSRCRQSSFPSREAFADLSRFKRIRFRGK